MGEVHPAQADEAPAIKQAVVYLRVSTKEQAEAGGEREGFSIPAQREACLRKAESLGAAVVEEFVDRGESAKSAARPELQRMLKFVSERSVDYVIVHKVDRLARNRVDDVSINLAFKHAGATLVSVTENIDETPSGVLLHGIMSSIAEFYSKNLANEVMKGVMQKVRAGGTVGRAPIGYRNVRRVVNGREVRTVELDPERAPLVREAFELYATGEWTLRDLLDELTVRGLRSVPGPRTQSKRLAVSQLSWMLHNLYYIGIVSYQGAQYPGAHEPLIPVDLFERVQTTLTAHDAVNGSKRRKHQHYLTGMLYCGHCESRLCLENVKGNGGRYSYFFCLGRQNRRTTCDMKAVRIERIESEVVRLYARVRIPQDLRESIERFIREHIVGERRVAEGAMRRAEQRRRSLLAQRDKLLTAHYAEAIPLDLLRSEQGRISEELDKVDRRITSCQVQFDAIEANLAKALGLLKDCQKTYREASPLVRRLLNLALFERFMVEEAKVRSRLAAPYGWLLSENMRTAVKDEKEEREDGGWSRVTYLRPSGNKTARQHLVLTGVGSNKDWLVVLTERCANRREIVPGQPLRLVQ